MRKLVTRVAVTPGIVLLLAACTPGAAHGPAPHVTQAQRPDVTGRWELYQNTLFAWLPVGSVVQVDDSRFSFDTGPDLRYYWVTDDRLGIVDETQMGRVEQDTAVRVAVEQDQLILEKVAGEVALLKRYHELPLDPETIAGSYEYEPKISGPCLAATLGTRPIRMELLKDGSVFIRTGGTWPLVLSGRYSLTDDQLKLTTTGGSQTELLWDGTTSDGQRTGGAKQEFIAKEMNLSCRVVLTRLALRVAGREFLRRTEGTVSPDPAAGQALVGRWSQASPDIGLEFKGDGALQVRSGFSVESCRYFVNGAGRLRVIYRNGTWATWRFALAGDQLQLSEMEPGYPLSGFQLGAADLHRSD